MAGLKDVTLSYLVFLTVVDVVSFDDVTRFTSANVFTELESSAHAQQTLTLEVNCGQSGRRGVPDPSSGSRDKENIFVDYSGHW
ncbi:hypothetical protein J6590_047626 [Homalodisca vitripennis]|nr:hypothetical protein J6590_047626 [Homalodisca vitripennis]